MIPKIRVRFRRMRWKLNMPVKWLTYKLKREAGPIFPDRLYVETTNICNLKCVMCPTGLGIIERKKGYMDFNLFKKIVDEMAPYVETVVVHAWGESLLHKEIFNMIHYAKDAGMRVETSTNVTLLTEEVALKVFDSGLDVLYLSLDGASKETYEKLRVGAVWEESLKNIENFLKLKREQKAKIVTPLQIIEMTETKEEITEFVKRWKRPEVNWINIKALDTWGGQIREINKLSLMESPVVQDGRLHCPNLWYHAYILWDGTLICCNRDFDKKFPLGNVKDGVLKVWNGPKMRELRRMHLEGKFHTLACANCVEWSWWTPTPFTSKTTGCKKGEAPESTKPPETEGGG